MGKYAKGYMASVTGVITTLMQTSESYCGTWYPAIVAMLGAVGVILVPNAKKSDET